VQPDSSVTVAFALLAGNSKPELEAAAQLAEIFYQNTALPLGMKDQKQGKGIHISPNPANESITIHTDSKFYSEMDLKISDNSGRTIHQQKIKSTTSLIVTSAIPSGIYFLSLYAGGEMIWNQRVMILHN